MLRLKFFLDLETRKCVQSYFFVSVSAIGTTLHDVLVTSLVCGSGWWVKFWVPNSSFSHELLITR